MRPEICHSQDHFQCAHPNNNTTDMAGINQLVIPMENLMGILTVIPMADHAITLIHDHTATPTAVTTHKPENTSIVLLITLMPQ